jgi:hypothetical protein
MTESLAWLRAPEAEHALGDLLVGLIRDIRRILRQPELGSAAKLGAITDTVERLVPSPGPQADAARTAARVMALLARNTGPATLLFEQLAGEQVRIELTERADRPLTAAECHDLELPPDTRGHYRAGLLRTVTSGLVAAEVTSLVIGPRIPPPVRRSLGIPGPGEPVPPPTGLPLGKALAALGVHREALGARLARDPAPGDAAPGDPAPGDAWSSDVARQLSVEAAARMWLAGRPVALATERVTGEFLAHVGHRAAPPGH